MALLETKIYIYVTRLEIRALTLAYFTYRLSTRRRGTMIEDIKTQQTLNEVELKLLNLYRQHAGEDFLLEVDKNLRVSYHFKNIELVIPVKGDENHPMTQKTNKEEFNFEEAFNYLRARVALNDGIQIDEVTPEYIKNKNAEDDKKLQAWKNNKHSRNLPRPH